MIIVAHQVDEVKGLSHGGHVIAVVDGVVARRDSGGDHQVVLLELGSHLPEELGMVLLVLGKPGAIVPTT